MLSAGNHVQYRPVTLGRAMGEYRVILTGLQPGEKIVTSGLQKVKPGDVVNPEISTAPMNTADRAALQPTG